MANAGLTGTKSRILKMLPTLIPQVLELGLAVLEGDDLRIRYEQLVSYPSYEIDAFSDLIERSPYTLEIKTEGSLGFAR